MRQVGRDAGRKGSRAVQFYARALAGPAPGNPARDVHRVAIPVGRLRFGPFRREQAFRRNIPLEAFLVSTGVVAGTTLGMLVADVPVVLIGNASAAKIPIKAIRIVAALMFAAPGIYTLLAVPVE